MIAGQSSIHFAKKSPVDFNLSEVIPGMTLETYTNRFYNVENFHKSLGVDMKYLSELIEKCGDKMGDAWLQEVRQMMVYVLGADSTGT